MVPLLCKKFLRGQQQQASGPSGGSGSGAPPSCFQGVFPDFDGFPTKRVPTSTPSPTSLPPTKRPTVTPSSQPSLSQQPTLSVSPSISFSPTMSFSPSISARPTTTPVPTLSAMPTIPPTISNSPTISQFPSNIPSEYVPPGSVVSVSLTLLYGFFPGGESEPTQDEVNALLAQTDAFFTIEFQGIYPDFQDLTISLLDTIYEPGFGFPVVTIDIEVDALFIPETDDIPSEPEIILALDAVPLDVYVENYVWASEPLFENVFYFVNEFDWRETSA